MRNWHRIAALIVLILVGVPAFARVSDPDGDADLPCVDITFLDVRADTQDLVVTLWMSQRPFPPGYLVKDLNAEFTRLCPLGSYSLGIDQDGDGRMDVLATTMLDRHGVPRTSGPEGLVVEVSIRQGRVSWTIPIASLRLPTLPREVRLQAGATLLSTGSPAEPRTPATIADTCPEVPQAFTIGPESVVLIDGQGGEVRIDDPSSPAFGSILSIPEGALSEPVGIWLAESADRPDFPDGSEPAFTVQAGPDGTRMSRAASLEIPVPQLVAPTEVPPSWKALGYLGRWTSIDNSDKKSLGTSVTLWALRTAIQYANYRQHVEQTGFPDPPALQEPIILLVHGWQAFRVEPPDLCAIGGDDTWGSLPALLASEGFRVWTSYYDSGQDINRAATEIGRQIVDLLQRTNDEDATVRIVAHSQGGIVARTYLRQMAQAGLTIPVEAVLTAGTPHHGANFAGLGGIACEAARQMRVCDEFHKWPNGLNGASDPSLSCAGPRDYEFLAAELDQVVDRDSALAMRCEDAAAAFGFGRYESGSRPMCADRYWKAEMPDGTWQHHASCYDYINNDLITESPEPAFSGPIPYGFDDQSTRMVIAGTYHTSLGFGQGIVDVRDQTHPSWETLLGFARRNCSSTADRRFELFRETKISWTEARDRCREGGGHLATVSSVEENTAIVSLLDGVLGVWLGGTNTGGTWAWITGEPFDYTNWDPGEPNNATGDEHYLQIWSPEYDAVKAGKWNDNALVSRHVDGYVCEFDYRVVYSPSITWEAADLSCRTTGGHLATITSSAENMLVTSVMRGFSTWIGGYKDLDGTWNWVTGEPFGCVNCFTNWHPGEPNNYGGRENFLELGGGLSYPEGFWNDNESPSRNVHGYVCEYEDLAPDNGQVALTN